MLKVLTASAGSGKTHRLTQEYIKLLLGVNDAYKHILAVTFTNKATDEMKSRVIETLNRLSQQQTTEGLKAKRVLTTILHDYSAFSVSTIDKFFQTTMKAFARELGQYASYSVELDSNLVLNQAIDNMLSSMSETNDKTLLSWLIDYSIALIEDGKSWDISKELQEMGHLFLREDFKLKRRQFEESFGDKSKIVDFRKKMNEIISSFEKKLSGIGNDGIERMKKYSLEPENFKSGSRSPFVRFSKWADGDVVEPSSAFFELPNDVSKWRKAVDDNGASIEAAYNDGLNQIVKEAAELFNEPYREYCTAKLLKNNLYLIGIFSDIYAALNTYLKENHLVLLGETADVLNRIIDGNDTPFIYEKIGTRYDHLMLDEFQDTSTIQWENFKPLFEESLAHGKDNLIVGDIKQSIYRWRGSDWKLLAGEAINVFDESVIEKEPLTFNWRSLENIVNFNNSFFTNIADLCDSTEEQKQSIRVIYGDCEQTLAPKNVGKLGHVKVSFVEHQAALEQIPQVIEKLTSVGYAKKDIAILVRWNLEGAEVADYLMSNAIEVITDDSLSISSSPVVKKVISVLRLLENPESATNKLLNNNILLNKESLDTTSLYDICESIIREDASPVVESEVPFVQAFMDMVIEYSSNYGLNVSGFLKWWDDKEDKPSISAPEGQDAVRIMTIHKAKGLGCDAVILPFFEEPFKPSNNHIPYIWCIPDKSPFDEIGLIPIKSYSALDSTIFSQDYHNEQLYSIIDSINAAYVACTRAKKELIILAQKPKFKKDGTYNLDNASAALYKHLGEEDEYELGNYQYYEDDSGKDSQIVEQLQTNYPSFAKDANRLKLSLRGVDFFNKEQGGDRRVRGIVLHDILSQTDVVDDLKNAVKQAVAQGELSKSLEDDTYAYLLKLIDTVAEKHWFDGTYRSINEISIVNTDGSLSRPDRVLVEKDKPISESKAIVIDYKFGNYNSRYQKQVDSYVNLLKQMGYKDVQGEVWYANSVE